MSPFKPLLTGAHEQDEVIEARLVQELNDCIADPEYMELPARAVLFRKDDPMDAVYVLISGQVKLYQLMDDREVVFHSQTAGRILGLLALTRRSRAFFDCTTITPVHVLKVPFDQLHDALQRNDSLRATFINVLLRSLTRRSTRLVEVQREVLDLNKRVARERDNLAQTLSELQKAQAMLVESEKMATLGQLAAGVAHELNNPIAAINRAADFMKKDLHNLAAELPDGDVFAAVIDHALTQKPMATKEQRAARRSLAQELNDENLAEQLVAMGIFTRDDYQKLARSLKGGDAEKISRLERYHQLGGALRNIATCSERIADLVKSLRSYSRNDGEDRPEIDVHEGLDDTLRLFANRLRDVQVERHYGDIPRIRANAGELNQVWTNLIANALDAMKDQGALILRTESQPNGILVVVTDNGPGIPPENLSKIFDVRFTTRQGRVEFGLGLGLSISQNIVARHGGRLEVASKPGETRFSVYLPLTKVDTQPETNRSA